jgi:hypothetical protein
LIFFFFFFFFFFRRDRRGFRTRSVRNLCRLFRLAMSCQPPATLGNGVVHDHIAWASTRHLGSLGLLSASASRTGARERPSAAKLWPLVAGATDGGQDDQRRLLYANRKVLISPVGENLLVLGGLVFTGSMHSRQSCPDVCDFSPAQPGRAAPRIRAWRRSEPVVRRDAWVIPAPWS